MGKKIQKPETLKLRDLERPAPYHHPIPTHLILFNESGPFPGALMRAFASDWQKKFLTIRKMHYAISKELEESIV